MRETIPTDEKRLKPVNGVYRVSFLVDYPEEKKKKWTVEL